MADHPKTIAEVSAFDPEARIDPHPKIKALREAEPVLYDEDGKTWVLTRYEDVRAALQDRTIARHPKNAEPGSFASMAVDETMTDEERAERGETILFLDDPDHSRIRTPFTQVFYPRIKAMEAEINASIDAIVDAAPATGEFDIMEEIALALPIHVIAKIIGVDNDRLDEFRAWSEDVILSLNPLRTPEENERMMAASEKLKGYFAGLMEERRKDPRDDLVSDLMQLQADGAELSDAEINVNLDTLLVAGNLTTTDLIGLGTLLLLKHPEEFEKLKADPYLAGSAVEEMLRFDSPVAVTARVVMDEREMGGCPMKPHQPMFTSLHGANRDPEIYDDPDRFDITRQGPPHVAFGGGQHICLGAPLARIEAKRFFTKLVKKYPNLRLSDAPDALEYRTLPLFRGIERLKVKAGN